MTESETQYASKLRSIIEDPDSFHLEFHYNQVREVLSEIYTQVDAIKKTAKQFEFLETQFVKPADIRPMQEQIEKLQSRLDQQASDFSTEIREIRAYFTYQLKDLNSKIDNGMASVISELSKPVSPAQSPAQQEIQNQFPIQDQTLRSDFEMLKERFEALMESLQSQQHTVSDEAAEEEEDEEEAQKEGEESSPQNDAEDNESQKSQSARTARSKGKREEDDENQSQASQRQPTGREEEDTERDSASRTQSPESKKDKYLKKVYELALSDMKVQIKNLIERTKNLEESAQETVPIVQQTRTDVDAMNTEEGKMKADILLLKSELQRMSEANNNSLAEAMKEINKSLTIEASNDGTISAQDVEKSIKAVRVQCAQQIAAMENNMSEEIRKLRADVAGLRAQQSNIQSQFNDIKDAPPPPPVTPPPTTTHSPKQ